jgi:STE24 endopeptidase
MPTNTYTIIILAALLLNFIINAAADLLNLKSLRTRLPEEFRDVYKLADYEKSQLYSRQQTRFGQVSAIFDLAVLLIFWFSGGFNFLDIMVRGLGYGPVISGLIYIGIIMLAKTIISLPFSIYSTFVIEDRFGFNRTTPAVFIADLGKGLLLAVVLGAPLLASILAFFAWAGPMAWLYGWGFAAAFTIIVQFVAPTWIMPLFNKFTPLADGELKTQIMAYAKSVRFTLDNVFVMDGSKRSSKSNAFFTGFGKHKRIALFDTLIDQHEVPELVAVLAHEIGHYKKKHILKGMLVSIIYMGFMFYLLGIFCYSQGLYEAFFMNQMPIYAGMIFFGLLFTPLEMLLGMVMNVWSRHNEFEADRFAVETVGNADNLILALKKLAAGNLANLTPHPFYVFWHYSHPPLLTRIKAMREVR